MCIVLYVGYVLHVVHVHAYMCIIQYVGYVLHTHGIYPSVLWQLQLTSNQLRLQLLGYFKNPLPLPLLRSFK